MKADPKDKLHYSCSKCGYHPDNEASYCAISCGLEFARMVRVSPRAEVVRDHKKSRFQRFFGWRLP